MTTEIQNNNNDTNSIKSVIDSLRLPISQPEKTLFVCNGCCCGHEEKGNPQVNNLLFMQLLNGEKNLTIEQPYCLGPCREANVIKVNIKDKNQGNIRNAGNNAKNAGNNAGTNYWFRRINTEQDVKDVAAFIKNPNSISANLNLREKQMRFR